MGTLELCRIARRMPGKELASVESPAHRKCRGQDLKRQLGLPFKELNGCAGLCGRKTVRKAAGQLTAEDRLQKVPERGLRRGLGGPLSLWPAGQGGLRGEGQGAAGESLQCLNRAAEAG